MSEESLMFIDFACFFLVVFVIVAIFVVVIAVVVGAAVSVVYLIVDVVLICSNIDKFYLPALDPALTPA